MSPDSVFTLDTGSVEFLRGLALSGGRQPTASFYQVCSHRGRKECETLRQRRRVEDKHSKYIKCSQILWVIHLSKCGLHLHFSLHTRAQTAHKSWLHSESKCRLKEQTHERTQTVWKCLLLHQSEWRAPLLLLLFLLILIGCLAPPPPRCLPSWWWDALYKLPLSKY